MLDSEARRYRENLQREIDGAAVYDALSKAAPDPKTAEIYRQLSATERRHAEFWQKKLGRSVTMRPGFQARVLQFLAYRFGPRFVLPILQADEVRGSRIYDEQADAVAAGLSE